MALISYALLGDDDQTPNYLHQRLLERLALTETVLVAGNGQQALELLHAHCAQPISLTCPALIVLDLKMPRMNGFEFLQAYAQRPPTENPAVVIMLTTSLNPDDVVKMRNLPIAGYLTKLLTTKKIQPLLQDHFG